MGSSTPSAIFSWYCPFWFSPISFDGTWPNWPTFFPQKTCRFSDAEFICCQKCGESRCSDGWFFELNIEVPYNSKIIKKNSYNLGKVLPIIICLPKILITCQLTRVWGLFMEAKFNESSRKLLNKTSNHVLTVSVNYLILEHLENILNLPYTNFSLIIYVILNI